MAGNHVFTDAVAPEVVRLLTNKLVHTQFFSRKNERDFNEGQPIGDTLRVKLPYRGIIRNGFGYVGANVDRRYTTIVADQMFGIDVDWDTIEKAVQMERSMEDISENILDPLTAQLAQECDSRAAQFVHNNTPNMVGALGTTPTVMSTYNATRTRLKELGGWDGSKRRGMIVSPQMMETVVAGSPNVIGLFNPRDTVAKAFKEGYIGEYGGYEWYESMSLYQQVSGVWANQSGNTVTGAGQAGSSILIACTTGDTFNVGDHITFGSVNAINPMTRRTNNRLKQFTITAATVGVGSAATLQISPAIVGPGSPYQNVDALPGNGAVLTLMPGTSMSNATAKTGLFGQAITNEAFALVGIDLPMPKSSAFDVVSSYTDPDTNITVGIIRVFDFDARKWKTRMDIWIGFGALLADNSACLIGSLN